MSSPSPEPPPNSILVIGSTSCAALISHELHSRSQRVFRFLTPHAPRPLPVYVGNGESEASARRIFGAETAAAMWELSRENLRLAVAAVPEVSEASGEKGLYWSDKAGSVVRLPALFCDPARVAALASAVPAAPVDRVVAIQPRGLSQRVTVETAGKRSEVEAEAVIWAAEDGMAGALPWMEEKLVTVTLSSFVFPGRRRFDWVLAVLNGGADYAFPRGDRLVIGSFRNLYQDHAVGIHRAADPVTARAATEFFGKLGWIDPRDEPETELSVEALSCDGLPIVGSVPGLPATYVVCGFAARERNFAFAIARRLVEGLLGREGFGALQVFSTRRFI